MKHFYNLNEFFADVVAHNGDRPAIVYKERTYTYRELDARSDAFVAYFRRSGIEQNDVIAIASTKSFDDYALMTACLKSGTAYVNLDVENPKKRLDDIRALCRPKALFASETLRGVIEHDAVHYDDIPASEAAGLPVRIDGETVAYIMFTSGSTGIPKGVAITHQNLIHLIRWIHERYEVTPDDVFANISPMYFDNSVFDFYGALFGGAALVPVEKALLTDPVNLVNHVDETGCTIWFSVPSMLMYLTTMRVLGPQNLRQIRVFTFGGEGYPKSELQKLFALYAERACFINVYGPTECTCICSSYTVSAADFDDPHGLPPLGAINPNFAYVILEPGGETKSDGVGELCLLGPNVGKGYYNDRERTEKSFFHFTDRAHYEKRMYRTGDLVEERDGLLFFKGRADNQIKHMGYRIELEEIELAVYTFAQIEACAVVYKRTSESYGKLIAYVAGKGELSSREIKAHLKERLPVYMVPNSIVVLDALPKNQNGKIDRKALGAL